MEGYGEAYSAVTVLNAFATGIGSAIGISLKVTVRVRKASEDSVRVNYMGREIAVDDILVNTILSHFRDRYGVRDRFKVEIETEIPPKKGLKSSSAVANALITALLDLLGFKLKEDYILSLNTRLSIEAGVSVTGALDDAAASLYGGLVVTDNHRGKILKRRAIGRKEVLIVYPDEVRETGGYRDVDFTPIRGVAKSIGDMLLRGLWREAAVLNGLVYSGYLRLDPRPIFKALELGAETAGLSGKGPAYYMIGGDMDGLASEMALEGYKTIWTYTR